jgi:OOP family OmpA-OmpF porin
MERRVATVAATAIATAMAIPVPGLADPARVDPERVELELGGTAGVRVFNNDSGLGVHDRPDAESQRNTALFGLRLGVYPRARFGVEAEVGLLPGEARSLPFTVWNLTYRASVLVQLRARTSARLVPFALVGAGAHAILSSARSGRIAPGTTTLAHAGLGVKYRTDESFGLRFDARLVLPPSSAGTGVTADLELLASVYRDFGRRRPAPPPPPERPTPSLTPPARDEDPDRDGISGAADACPTEAEDRDGSADDDGCPELDDDGDGVLDAADACPAEAEDRDGFADDDGCPDLDNDGDGVPDAADRCPTEPETRNGFLDSDGCADVVPERLRKLTAAPLPMAWRPNAAELAPGAGKILDEVAAALAEGADVVVEIGVHTDDQPPPAGSKLADNQALSQARAEAAKAYLADRGVDAARVIAKGYGSTAPLEDPTGLPAPRLAAARGKNRRVELKLIVQPPAAPPVPAP